jgi:CPA2 family monovalent cation:H+ antiporter-2
VSNEDSQPVLASLVLSMALAPIVLRYNGRIAARLLGGSQQARADEQMTAQATSTLSEHVILCGYGRTGQSVARFLMAENIPFIALDMDIDQVQAGCEAGGNVIYGDAGHADMLRAAGLRNARALIISIENERDVLRIVDAARAQRQDLPILVRARDESALQRLLAAGATEGVPETLEASMMLVTQLLVLLGLAPSEVIKGMDAARGKRYRRLGGLNEHEDVRVAENGPARGQ